eukprot:jgi/Psemu1/283903/fgenesh1_pg.36_\
MATIARCVASIAFLAIVLTPLAYAFRCNFHICPQKNGFNCPRRKEGIELSCIVEALHGIHRRKYDLAGSLWLGLLAGVGAGGPGDVRSFPRRRLQSNRGRLGGGVGVEAQAAAMLGAREVIATDIHPTTLQQLEFGVSRNEQLSSSSDTIVRTEILDLFRTREEQPIPSPCDLLVVADVLYNEELATQVCRRCAEALEENSGIRILVTDSQRFVPGFLDELNQALGQVSSSSVKSLATWKVETMKSFEGSGVIIDEDQTYDVTVQSLWVGL